MRGTVLIMLLAFAGGSAAADWTKWVVIDQKERFTVYADVATIRKSGDMAQMWDMSDIPAGKGPAGSKQSPSFKMEREYDCNKQQLRVLYVSWHAENMGEGKMIGNNANPGSWQPALLGTIGERLWKVACGVGSSRHL